MSTAKRDTASENDPGAIWNKVEESLDRVPPIMAHAYEQVPLGENESSRRITRVMFDIKMATYQAKKAEHPDAIAERDAHAKGHACVRAKLTFHDIAEEFQTDIFRSNANYDVIIRYSNGSGEVGGDQVGDGRGMAVKILNASEKPNFFGEASEQDFMMINNPRFFIRNVSDYEKFQNAMAKGLVSKDPDKFAAIKPFLLERNLKESLGEELADHDLMQLMGVIATSSADPQKLVTGLMGVLNDKAKLGKVLAGLGAFKAGKAPEELRIMQEITGQPARNPFDYTYNSMTPYLLSGSGVSPEQIVKYSSTQIDCATDDRIKSDKVLPLEQTMAESIEQSLRVGKVCFGFSVDVLDPKLPLAEKQKYVEDANRSWSGVSSSQGLAKIEIPEFAVNPPLSREDCENLSFNPWKSFARHRPLGGLNRVRRFAVTASFARRSFVNKK